MHKPANGPYPFAAARLSVLATLALLAFLSIDCNNFSTVLTCLADAEQLLLWTMLRNIFTPYAAVQHIKYYQVMFL